MNKYRIWVLKLIFVRILSVYVFEFCCFVSGGGRSMLVGYGVVCFSLSVTDFRLALNLRTPKKLYIRSAVNSHIWERQLQKE